MDFPNLNGVKRLAVDVETCDPGLDAGAGPAVRSGGFIAGLAVGTTDNQWYFPMRHERGKNLDPEHVIAWAKDNILTAREVLGAGIIYDLDYLAQEGVAWDAGARFIDVLVAEPLLDENRFDYSLGAVASQHNLEGKDEADLYRWCADTFGGAATRKAQAKNIWRAPGEIVAPYARSDVRLPFEIHQKQWPAIRRDELDRVWDIEMRLIPMLLAMRRRGVKVDLERADQLTLEMAQRIEQGLKKLEGWAGRRVSAKSPIDIGEMFDRYRIPYSMTPKSKKASITKGYLEELTRSDRPEVQKIANLILDTRKWMTIRSTFLQGYVLGQSIDGRIHCEFHQMRRGDDGTRSGRFSSANPNLQNIPSRDEELAPLIRGLFVPEEGEDWYCDDWSQIEFRFLVHYGSGQSAEEARMRYKTDPDTDYHEWAQGVVKEKAGKDIGRKPTKNLNFGLIYGMGLKKTAASMGVSEAVAEDLRDTYFHTVPFIKDLFDDVAGAASARGYIRTILGRRRRFHMWEARKWKLAQKLGMSVDKAEMLTKVREAGGAGVRRAMTHKALNALLQGGAADAMKLAMVNIWESGVCDILGPPLLTVHDELDWSVPRTREAHEAHQEAVRMMATAVDLRVPLAVDVETGPNWGDVK